MEPKKLKIFEFHRQIFNPNLAQTIIWLKTIDVIPFLGQNLTMKIFEFHGVKMCLSSHKKLQKRHKIFIFFLVPQIGHSVALCTGDHHSSFTCNGFHGLLPQFRDLIVLKKQFFQTSELCKSLCRHLSDAIVRQI